MAFWIKILKALWAMHPQRFWLIWIAITTAAVIYVMSVVGQVETPRSQKETKPLINLIPMWQRAGTPIAVVAATLLVVFLASYIAMILAWEDFAYYDNDMFILYTLKSQDLATPIWHINGPFFPLGHLEFNLIRHFTDTAIGYHVLPIAQLLIFFSILLVLDAELSIKARAALRSSLY